AGHAPRRRHPGGAALRAVASAHRAPVDGAGRAGARRLWVLKTSGGASVVAMMESTAPRHDDTCVVGGDPARHLVAHGVEHGADVPCEISGQLWPLRQDY